MASNNVQSAISNFHNNLLQILNQENKEFVKSVNNFRLEINTTKNQINTFVQHTFATDEAGSFTLAKELNKLLICLKNQAVALGDSNKNQQLEHYEKAVDNYRGNVRQKMKILLAIDHFTMMPYHDVEAKLNELEKAIENLSNDISITINSTEKGHEAVENKLNELAIALNSTQSFELEMRLERERLKSLLIKTRCKEQISLLSCRYMEKLKDEIAHLEKEFADLRINNDI
ncbi:uncharacterized protein LOC119688186 [Teleopsis dalmanni]|uniref:uncharacterized protein LOC119688186 n=1 Tax=Teleopsis dalmanni TaxID=139649 RepID=UPI0018CE82D3|nr:uncharacterized protein LOC119688186 [Teleopsis dalmanni]